MRPVELLSVGSAHHVGTECEPIVAKSTVAEPPAPRFCTGTDSLQLAKEKLRQFEWGQPRGDDNPLPTKTPLADVLSAYVQQVRAVKTPKSAQTDVDYLREIFGPIVPALQITSRRSSASTRMRPVLLGHDRRRRAKRIEVTDMEDVTTADVSAFISGHMQSRCLVTKTANRYRAPAGRAAVLRQPARCPSPPTRAKMTTRCRESSALCWPCRVLLETGCSRARLRPRSVTSSFPISGGRTRRATQIVAMPQNKLCNICKEGSCAILPQ